MDNFENSDEEVADSAFICKVESISQISRFKEVVELSNNEVVAILFTGKFHLIKADSIRIMLLFVFYKVYLV